MMITGIGKKENYFTSLFIVHESKTVSGPDSFCRCCVSGSRLQMGPWVRIRNPGGQK
jgi:hypothetical protein